MYYSAELFRKAHLCTVDDPGATQPQPHQTLCCMGSNKNDKKNFPWLIDHVPRLLSHGYISQLVRFVRCCNSASDFNSKNPHLTSKLLIQGYRYHKLRETFGKFFGSYSDLYSKFGEKYVTEGIAPTVFYGVLVYKLSTIRCEANFVSSGSKIVLPLPRQTHDQVIIERTISIVLCPSTAMYGSFLKHCTLTNKVVGTIWRDLSQPPQRRQGPDSRPLWLLVGIALVLDLSSLQDGRNIAYSGGCLSLFLIHCFYHLTCFVFILWPFRFGWLLVLDLLRRIIYKFLNVCHFDYTAFTDSGKVGIP